MSERLPMLWDPDEPYDDEADIAAENAADEKHRAECEEAGWTPETYRQFCAANPRPKPRTRFGVSMNDDEFNALAAKVAEARALCLSHAMRKVTDLTDGEVAAFTAAAAVAEARRNHLAYQLQREAEARVKAEFA